MIRNSETSNIAKIVIGIIKERKPESVKQLVKILKESHGLAEEEIIRSVNKLQAEGVIRFENQALRSGSFANYLRTGGSLWYWLIIAGGAITAVLSFTMSESAYPWVYARNLLSLIFILFLPGFAFAKALFPTRVSEKMATGKLDGTEKIALSIGMSIAFVSIIGLLLYYSPWGLNLVTVVPALFAFTSIFATMAVIREYYITKPI